MNRRQHLWSKEDKAALKRLRVEEGLSYGQIAERLGVTKNAVCGQAARMQISDPGQSPIRRLSPEERQRRQARKDPKVRAAVPPPKKAGRAVLRLVDPAELRQRLGLDSDRGLGLGKRQPGGGGRCQWIEGEPRADDGCKCGAPTVQGQPWCADHLLRVWKWEPAA